MVEVVTHSVELSAPDATVTQSRPHLPTYGSRPLKLPGSSSSGLSGFHCPALPRAIVRARICAQNSDSKDWNFEKLELGREVEF